MCTDPCVCMCMCSCVHVDLHVSRGCFVCFSGAVLLHPGYGVCTCVHVCNVCVYTYNVCAHVYNECDMSPAVAWALPSLCRRGDTGRDLICLAVPAGRCQVGKARCPSRHPLTRDETPSTRSEQASPMEHPISWVIFRPRRAAASDLWPRERLPPLHGKREPMTRSHRKALDHRHPPATDSDALSGSRSCGQCSLLYPAATHPEGSAREG